jgi:hypothetical protein
MHRAPKFVHIAVCHEVDDIVATIQTIRWRSTEGVWNRSAEVLETGVLTAETRRLGPGVNARVDRRVELKTDAELIECRVPP